MFVMVQVWIPALFTRWLIYTFVCWKLDPFYIKHLINERGFCTWKIANFRDTFWWLPDHLEIFPWHWRVNPDAVVSWHKRQYAPAKTWWCDHSRLWPRWLLLHLHSSFLYRAWHLAIQLVNSSLLFQTKLIKRFKVFCLGMLVFVLFSLNRCHRKGLQIL